MRLMLKHDWLRSVHQQDGIAPKKEAQIRKDIGTLIITYGRFLDQSMEVIAKGIYIFYAFAHQNSFKRFDRHLYGAASIFLAAKASDEPRSLEKCVKVFFYLNHLRRTNGLEGYDFERFGQDQVYADFVQSLEKKQVAECKERFIEGEYSLLKHIAFDPDIQVPYKYLGLFQRSAYFQSMGLSDSEFIEISKRFVNDSLLTTMCLYFEPYVIALAALNMTSVYLEKELEDTPEGLKWYQVLQHDLDPEYLEEAIGVLKEVYHQDDPTE